MAAWVTLMLGVFAFSRLRRARIASSTGKQPHKENV
jgi:hypothetical protein